MEDGYIGWGLSTVDYLEEVYSTGKLPSILYNGYIYNNLTFSPSQEDLKYIRQIKAHLTSSLVSSFSREYSEHSKVCFYRIYKNNQCYIIIDAGLSNYIVPKEGINALIKNIKKASEILESNYYKYQAEFRNNKSLEINIPGIEDTVFESLKSLRYPSKTVYFINYNNGLDILYINIKTSSHLFMCMTKRDITNYIKSLETIRDLPE